MAPTSQLATYLGLMVPILFFAVCGIVWYYAEPGFPWHTYPTVILGYFAAFAILLLVPIDIATVVTERRSTSTNDDQDYSDDRSALFVSYNTFFTMVLLLGSVILTYQENYNQDGYFTFLGRFASGLKRQVIKLIGPLIVGVIILGILIGQNVVEGNAEAIKLVAVIVTNTVYEFVLMFLLAYAIVEFPRSFWDAGNLDKDLLKTQMKAALEFKVISDAQLSVSLAVSDVLKTQRMLPSHSEKKLHDAIAVIASECPPEFRSDRLGTVAANKEGKITIHTLADLRTRLTVLKSKYKMAQQKVEGTKIRAYNLEDIVAAKNNANVDCITWSLTEKTGTHAEYRWHTFWLPLIWRVIAVILGMLSIFSFLGVICSMHGVTNDVSVYFLAVHNSDTSVSGIAIFIMITLGYTVYITSWAIFQIKIAGMMELVPHRTTAKSLSFNARMIARFAAPLAFFYLGWIAENGIESGQWQYNDAKHDDEALFMPSSFSAFYKLQEVGAIKASFGTMFPVIFFIALSMFILNLFNRTLVLLKLDQFQFGAAFVTEEQLREGKRQLQRNKRITQRAYQRGAFSGMLSKMVGAKDKSEGGWGLGLSRASSSKSNRFTESEDSAKLELKEPVAVAGVCEKKSAKALGFGANWKEAYATVRSPGYLHLYKDKRAATEGAAKDADPSFSSDKNTVVVDLRLVLDFKVATRSNKGKDKDALDLVLSEDILRIKLRNQEEVVEWKNKLQEWKDFCVDYGTLYPMGVAAGIMGGDGDVEAGGAGERMSTASNASRASSAAKNSPGRSSPSKSSTKGSLNPLISPVGATGGGDNGGGGLNDIQIGVDDDDDDQDSSSRLSKQRPETRQASSSIGIGMAPIGAGAAAAGVTSGKPDSLEGWVEKKGHGMRMGGDWQKRYMRIDEQEGCLVYAKSSSPGEPASGTLDLKVAQDIVPYDKSGRPDYTRFSIDMGGRVYKFKVASEMDGRRWVDGLNEWKDHFLLNM